MLPQSQDTEMEAPGTLYRIATDDYPLGASLWSTLSCLLTLGTAFCPGTGEIPHYQSCCE